MSVEMPEVWIPTQMQFMTRGERQVRIAGSTVRHVIDNLDAEYPGLKTYLSYEGEVMPGIAVFVDGEDTHLGMLQPVGEDSEVHFLPSIAGG